MRDLIKELQSPFPNLSLSVSLLPHTLSLWLIAENPHTVETEP